jgi:hypothetical protein
MGILLPSRRFRKSKKPHLQSSSNKNKRDKNIKTILRIKIKVGYISIF